MPPARKAGQVASLTLAVRQLSLARLRAESPDASEHDLRVKLAALWLPDDLLNRVLAYERARHVA